MRGHTTQTTTGKCLTWLVQALIVAALVSFPSSMALAQATAEDSSASEDAEASAANEDGDAKEEAGPQVNQPAPDLFAAPARSSFGGFRIVGDLQFALRSVNVDGAEDRFRQDFGFNDGVTIQNSKLSFVPDGANPASWFDRLEIYGDGIGFDNNKQDKYRSWGVSANKAGSYRFKFDSRNVNYFWSSAASHNRWDADRRLTSAELGVDVTSGLELTGTFRQYRQTGDGLATRDISRNEFVLDEPLDQKGTTWGIGARWRIDRTVLFVKQEFRKFEDNARLLSGSNTGLSPDEAFLNLLSQSEVREMDAPMTTAGFSTSFADSRFLLSGDIFLSTQDMVVDYSRLWTGQDFLDRPISETTGVDASVERKVRHGNVQLLYRPTRHFSLTGKYRRRGWDQTAGQGHSVLTEFLAVGSQSENSTTVATAHEITLDEFVFGAEWAPSLVGSVYGEIGTGTRSQSFVIDGDANLFEDTKTTSYKIGGRLRPTRAFDAQASYSKGDFDNPFSRVSPTTRDRFRVKLRWRPAVGWQVSGLYNYDKNKNQESPAEYRFNNLGLSVSYSGTAGRYLYFGYNRLDVDMSVDTLFPVSFVSREHRLLYDHVENVWSVGGEFRVSPGTPLSLYGNLSYVDSDGVEQGGPGDGGTIASVQLPLTYYDGWVGARYVFHMGVFVDVHGRFMKYEDTSELLSALDSYDGSMFVLGLGYQF